MMPFEWVINKIPPSRTVFALLDQFVISGTRFVTSWMIARFCGAEQLGLFALGFIILVLIDLVLQAFVSAPYTVFAQRATNQRLTDYTSTSLAMAVLVGLLGSLVFATIGFIATLAHAPQLASVMYVLVPVVGFCVLREFARRQCFSSGRIELAFGFDAFYAVIQLGTMYALLHHRSLNAISAHAACGLACAAALGIWLYAVRNDLKSPSQRWRWHVKRHWRFGKWVFITQTTNQLNWNVTQWIIAVCLGTEAIGIFTGCLTIAFLSNPFVLGIANILYPRLAQLHNPKNDRLMEQMAIRAASAIGIVMFTFTLLMLIFGQFICDFLYADPAYSSVNILLASLAAAVSCLAVTMPIDGCLWAKKRTDCSSIASGVGLTITSTSVLMLIPWGTTGAAIGLLLGCLIESATRIVLYFRCRRDSDAQINTHAFAS